MVVRLFPGDVGPALWEVSLVGLGMFLAACSDDRDEPPTLSIEDGAATATDPFATQMIEIPVNDFVFDARVAGPVDGEVVFLLHGFPQTSYEWRHALPALAQAGYRAIAPDQRGYSPRARPTAVAEYAISTLVQDVLDMADTLGVERFHVVGHDWGAGVAWSLASVAQERILSLTAVSVPHLDAFYQELANPSSCQYAASSYFDFFVSPEATAILLNDDAAMLRTIYAGMPEDAVAAYLGALATPEALDGGLAWYRANIASRQLTIAPLGPIQVPTLFVWSSGDTAICREAAELSENFVSGRYRFEIIADVSHFVVEFAADVFNDGLLSHLRAYPGAGG